MAQKINILRLFRLFLQIQPSRVTCSYGAQRNCQPELMRSCTPVMGISLWFGYKSSVTKPPIDTIYRSELAPIVKTIVTSMLRANKMSSLLTHKLSGFIWELKRYPYKISRARYLEEVKKMRYEEAMWGGPPFFRKAFLKEWPFCLYAGADQV